MTHMVDRMMYAGEVPWHGLGIHLPETCDSETLKRLVFPWHVIEATPQATAYAEESAGMVNVACSGYTARLRSDNHVVLAIVPKTNALIEYPEAFDVMNAASVDGSARFITAGTLDEGRRAWALATIPSAEFKVAGSLVKPYLLGSTSHDSSLAIRYHFTSTYVVCNNTLTGALAQAGAQVGGRARTKHLPNVLMLKHTSKAKERLQVAKALIAQATNYFGAFSERALFMVNQRFTTESMCALVRELFPTTAEQDVRLLKDGVASAAHDARRKVLYLFNGEQRAREQAPGTRWAAFNALTEYIDHHTKRRGHTASELAEARLDGIMFGSGAALRQQGLDLLLAA